MGIKLHYFDWLDERPYNQSAFYTVIGITRTDISDDWFRFHPANERLPVAESDTLFVDIGGGLRHDLIAFKKRIAKISRQADRSGLACSGQCR